MEICTQIMGEDRAMAERIMAGLPEVVTAHIGTIGQASAGRAASGEQMGQPRADEPVNPVDQENGRSDN